MGGTVKNLNGLYFGSLMFSFGSICPFSLSVFQHLSLWSLLCSNQNYYYFFRCCDFQLANKFFFFFSKILHSIIFIVCFFPTFVSSRKDDVKDCQYLSLGMVFFLCALETGV